ncbi:hypothetical protein IFM89_002405 [Coptis chinensis]|uniref:SANT domain-containing protein n=1 Tax=Coptis chinensis TaxID=261450 RepID=A0A835IGV0_9MAGN|nr:hypothetical protein IFM89_002405 [Coptis chinensis]
MAFLEIIESYIQSLQPGTQFSYGEELHDWTKEERDLFNNALAEFNHTAPYFFDALMHRLPGKSVTQIVTHYFSFVEELVRLQTRSTPIYDNDAGKEPILNEHRFPVGLNQYGRGEQTNIANCVQSRNPTQVSSQAQSYFYHRDRLVNERKGRGIIDIIQNNIMKSKPFLSNKTLKTESIQIPESILRNGTLHPERLTASQLMPPPPPVTCAPSMNNHMYQRLEHMMYKTGTQPRQHLPSSSLSPMCLPSPVDIPRGPEPLMSNSKRCTVDEAPSLAVIPSPSTTTKSSMHLMSLGVGQSSLLSNSFRNMPSLSKRKNPNVRDTDKVPKTLKKTLVSSPLRQTKNGMLPSSLSSDFLQQSLVTNSKKPIISPPLFASSSGFVPKMNSITQASKTIVSDPLHTRLSLQNKVPHDNVIASSSWESIYDCVSQTNHNGQIQESTKPVFQQTMVSPDQLLHPSGNVYPWLSNTLPTTTPMISQTIPPRNDKPAPLSFSPSIFSREKDHTDDNLLNELIVSPISIGFTSGTQPLDNPTLNGGATIDNQSGGLNNNAENPINTIASPLLDLDLDEIDFPSNLPECELMDDIDIDTWINEILDV